MSPTRFRFTVHVHTTRQEEDRIRAEHGLPDGAPVRDRLAAVIRDELDGIGEESGLWSRVDVS
ncbi:MAG TPA: hypothetical protein VKZ89_07785 [Thermobifida alba]|nr:hypothetical protein [Thermobifida alba]